MNLGIYKQGQGFWTRVMTFLGGMVMFGWGAVWLQSQISRLPSTKPFGLEPVLLQGGIVVTILLIGVIVCYRIAYNSARTGEFFIDTEGEMKKVNWSSWKEVRGSTLVVVTIALLLGLSLFAVDIAFSRFFQAIGVLQSSS